MNTGVRRENKAEMRFRMRRDQFIRVARSLFLTKGYGDTSIGDILRTVDDRSSSVNVFYYYFESKMEIYELVLKEYTDEYIREIVACIEGGPARSDIGHRFLAFYIAVTRFFVACHALSSESNRLHSSFSADTVSRVVDQSERVYAELLRNISWDIGVCSAEFLAKMVAGSILRVALGFLESQCERPRNVPVSRLAMQVADHTMRMSMFPDAVRSKIMADLRIACDDLMAIGAEALESGAKKIYDVKSIKVLMENLACLADTVRIVDPAECRVLVIDPNGDLQPGDKCHGVWGRDVRCENCISRECVAKDARTDKYELLDGSVFLISSFPIAYRNSNDKLQRCAIELINTTPERGWFSRFERDKPLWRYIEDHTNLYRDPLTGVYSRWFFDDRSFSELLGAGHVKKVAFLMCDIHGFRNANDTYGREHGDALLRGSASAIGDVLRDTDMVIRMGADEFLVVLSGCNDAQARGVAADIAGRVAKVTYDPDGKLPVRIDAGMACTDEFTGEEAQILGMYESASRMLYEEKCRAD